VLVKLNARCGVDLTVRYDVESLKANNKDLGWDQTGGDRECNEPLRYRWALWAAFEADGSRKLKR